METKYVLQIDGKLTATITLTGAGQQPPDEITLVRGQCNLALPTGELGHLVPELWFGDITINAPLYEWWGKSGDGCRYATKKFHAKTWKEARGQAAKWAREELKPLKKALAERAKALKEAGDWE